ncbi:MAG: hypothetical protein Q9221_005138 [Calogaya cf. arnoldii]
MMTRNVHDGKEGNARVADRSIPDLTPPTSGLVLPARRSGGGTIDTGRQMRAEITGALISQARGTVRRSTSSGETKRDVNNPAALRNMSVSHVVSGQTTNAQDRYFEPDIAMITLKVKSVQQLRR